ENRKEKDEIEWKAEWISWNDKLNPSQQYQWKLLLKNVKNNKTFQGEFLASMYDASLDRIVSDHWDTNASKINNYTYVSFSDPQKRSIAHRNSIYNSRSYFSNELYWNRWNYYNYDFNNEFYYNQAFDVISYELISNKKKYFDIEVRDAVTGKVISNALVYNFKTDEENSTNEDGFASLLGKKAILLGVVALGYEEIRLEVNKPTTIVHLQPSTKESSLWKVDFNKTRNTWYNIYYQFKNDFSDASKSVQDEVQFMETVIKKDNEVNLILVEDSIDDDSLDEIVVNSYRTISKSKRNVAASTVSSKTIEGRPNATVVETLQGQVPGLNVSTGTGQPNDSTYIAFTNTTSSTIYGMIKGEQNHETISLRKNLSETAFFYPHLVF